MRALNLFSIDSVDHIVTPQDFTQITLESPAMQVFTDFERNKPLMLDSQMLASEALQLMRSTHVNVKLVVNKNADFCGVVKQEDISTEQIIKAVAKGAVREELTVADFMLPSEKLTALDFHELKDALVADLVDVMSKHELQYCLVVDHRKHQIRGIISANEIARQLHVPMLTRPAPTFLEIFSAVHS